MRTEFLKRRRKLADKAQRGLEHYLLISILVLCKPLSVVIALQLPQELKQVRAKERILRH
jgi:hypothetical protein